MLSRRELVVGILLLTFEQLARKPLVQLGLFGLYRACGVRVIGQFVKEVKEDRNKGV